MTLVPAVPDPAARPPVALTPEQGAALADLHAFLAHPVNARHVGLTMLAKYATDPTMPARDRRHAAETLARLEVQALQLRASLSGLRETTTEGLATAAGASAVAVARVEQTTRIEIIRETDWRDGGDREA